MLYISNMGTKAKYLNEMNQSAVKRWRFKFIESNVNTLFWADLWTQSDGCFYFVLISALPQRTKKYASQQLLVHQFRQRLISLANIVFFRTETCFAFIHFSACELCGHLVIDEGESMTSLPSGLAFQGVLIDKSDFEQI